MKIFLFRTIVICLLIFTAVILLVFLFRFESKTRTSGFPRWWEFSERRKFKIPSTKLVDKLRAPTLVLSDIPSASQDDNPFGIMVGGKNIDNANRMKVAKELGVTYYRPLSAVFLDRWNGGCNECDEALSNNLKLVLTIRNNGGGGQPATPPADYSLYKKSVGEILDRYRPTLLVVENEENSRALFYNGTPQQYHEELKAACGEAHARELKCANGGLVSSLVALLVADSYLEKGQDSRAYEYLTRTLGTKLSEEFGLSDPARVFTNPKVAELIKRGKTLVAGYKANGADYVNFHWYIADTPALEEAVAYLQNASGLTTVTNEFGQQKNEDPAQVTAMMQKVIDLKLPIAVWFSADIQGYGRAKALTDENGILRPNGIAFRDFIAKNFN